MQKSIKAATIIIDIRKKNFVQNLTEPSLNDCTQNLDSNPVFQVQYAWYIVN